MCGVSVRAIAETKQPDSFFENKKKKKKKTTNTCVFFSVFVRKLINHMYVNPWHSTDVDKCVLVPVIISAIYYGTQDT